MIEESGWKKAQPLELGTYSDFKTYAGSSDVVERYQGDEIEVGGSTPSPRTNPADTERDPHKGKFIRWGERLGLPECPYLRRWVMEFGTNGPSIRIHHFFSSDDDRAFHDHPWWFLTFVLKGSYVDYSPAGRDQLRVGSVRFRRAYHKHTVETDGVWTIVITGPRIRAWGFWDHATGKFLKANKWFFTRGHHPCE